jgi:hypothetical protein
MSATNQDDKKPFEVAASAAKSGQADVLEVEVRNTSADTYTGQLLVELKLPAQMVSQDVADASARARGSKSPPNMTALAGVVAPPAGWTVWAYNSTEEHVVVVRVFNSEVNRTTARTTAPYTSFAAGASLKLQLPLSPAAASTLYTLDYSYFFGSGKGARVDGKINIAPAGQGDWKPGVKFWCEHATPTMLAPGTEVNIRWEIEDGVAATLRGPLPGGNTQLFLTREASGPYNLEKGSLPFLAVGPATYMLDAEVKGPKGQPNVQVIRTLTFDIFSAQKYAHVSVRPDGVMPNGQVQIKWAVWGVETASIKVGIRQSLELKLTEQNLSGSYQGTGVWRINAASNVATERVRLSITQGDETHAVTSEINTNLWEKISDSPAYTGRPVAMAVAEGHLGLLTTEGVWVAKVNAMDEGSQEPKFSKLQWSNKSWHGLAALGPHFAALFRQPDDNFVIECYYKDGRILDGMTMPSDFQAVARRTGATFDMVSFGGRVYVVVTAPFNTRYARVAYSVSFLREKTIRPEPRLASLDHYRLVSFDDALYAYHRGTGRMLRFGVTGNGELGPPLRAASAVNDEGVSMIKTGTIVPLRSILAVLDPSALPAFLTNQTNPLMALLNVAGFSVKNLQTQLKSGDALPQDIVYNPQKDKWVRCGRGLKVEDGTVVGYRGGDSPRLWAVRPDGSWHMLAGATEKAFAPEFVYQYTTKPLPPALDAVREFTISNRTGLDFVPLDDVCQKGALASFEADGPAELLTPIPQSIKTYGRQVFKVAYSKEETSEVVVRMMVGGCRGLRYFLEVILSGADLQKTTYAFRRLADDGSVASVPGASEWRVGNDVAVSMTGVLGQRTSLYLMNQTPHNSLRLDPPAGPQEVSVWDRVDIGFQTPRFKVYVSGEEKLGHLWVDIDFAATGGDCEVSSGSRPQQSRVRLNPDGLKNLELSSETVTGSSARMREFEKYDGSKFRITPSNQDVMVSLCQIRLRTKTELDGVRLGDGALTPDRKRLVLALANPDNVARARVLIFDTTTLEARQKEYDTKANVFSVPNAVAASTMYYDAVFAEPVRYTADYNFGVAWPQHFQGYDAVLALAASTERNVFNVLRKGNSFYLTVAYYGNNSEETLLDNISHPSVIPPLAVSPDGSTAAIGDKGGLLIVDMRAGAGARRPRSVRIRTATEPMHLVFSNDGRWVYCAHASPAMSENPRRALHGSNLLVSRVSAHDATQASLALPNVPEKFGLTTNTRQPRPMNETYKEQYAFSLAVSPDDRSLFVSAGATIMQVRLDTFALTPWRASVELPCRLVGVAPRSDNAWMVFALGSRYVGDGVKVDEYKSHLYHVLGPKV